MKKTLLITILTLICGAAAFAGNGVDKAAESGFILRKHEIAAGGSFQPGSIIHELGWCDDTERLSYDNAWWLSYTYNFTKLFALQFSVTYDGITKKVDAILNPDAQPYHEYYITPMISFRCSWLNRKIVRLYSSAGIGLMIDSVGWYKGGDSRLHRCSVGWQVTPIGISVGKKLYGYAELGAGTQYAIGCAGIGYRF